MDSKSLIESASLSAQTTGILINNLSTAAVAGAQGAGLDSLAGDDVTLYVRIIDQSSSMSPFQRTVIDAANEQLTALAKSKAADSILMSSILFDTKVSVLHSYLPLSAVKAFDAATYTPGGSTALYDATLDGITAAVSYAQSLRDAGIRVKIVVVVLSDGKDNQSTHTATAVKQVVEDLLKQEVWTFAFVAFGMSGKSVAAQMGFPNVLDEQATAHDIRLAFDTVSKSVIGASQSVIGSNNFFN